MGRKKFEKRTNYNPIASQIAADVSGDGGGEVAAAAPVVPTPSVPELKPKPEKALATVTEIVRPEPAAPKAPAVEAPPKRKPVRSRAVDPDQEVSKKIRAAVIKARS